MVSLRVVADDVNAIVTCQIGRECTQEKLLRSYESCGVVW